MDKVLILGIIAIDGTGMTKWDKFDKAEDYMYELRVIGNNNRKLELFFAVQSKFSVVELVKAELEYCKKKWFSIMTKKINMKHIKWIGFLNGPYIKFTNNDLYIKEIHQITNIE